MAAVASPVSLSRRPSRRPKFVKCSSSFEVAVAGQEFESLLYEGFCIQGTFNRTSDGQHQTICVKYSAEKRLGWLEMKKIEAVVLPSRLNGPHGIKVGGTKLRSVQQVMARITMHRPEKSALGSLRRLERN